MKKISVALGLTVNDQGKFLISLRNDPGNKRAHLKWEIPGGGVEKGETIEEAVKRELKEEVGVTIAILPYSPFVIPIRNLLLTIVLCKITSGDIVLDQNESIDYKWVTLEELSKLPFLVRTDEIVERASRLLSKDNYDSK
jgi:mutator protein MutT